MQKAKFSDMFTDALGRLEIKNVLGVIGFVGSFVYLFISHDGTGFGVAIGASIGLFVTTSVADSHLDTCKEKE